MQICKHTLSSNLCQALLHFAFTAALHVQKIQGEKDIPSPPAFPPPVEPAKNKKYTK